MAVVLLGAAIVLEVVDGPGDDVVVARVVDVDAGGTARSDVQATATKHNAIAHVEAQRTSVALRSFVTRSA